MERPILTKFIFFTLVTDSLESGDREQDQKRERSFRHKTVTEGLSELSMT